MKFPKLHKYISAAMGKAGIETNIELLRKVQTQAEMGHEFIRLIVNGESLPEVKNARAIAYALGVDPLEFLCLVENCRLEKRGLSKILQVIPIKQ